jgi:hypothetical protein
VEEWLCEFFGHPIPHDPLPRQPFDWWLRRVNSARGFPRPLHQCVGALTSSDQFNTNDLLEWVAHPSAKNKPTRSLSNVARSRKRFAGATTNANIVNKSSSEPKRNKRGTAAPIGCSGVYAQTEAPIGFRPWGVSVSIPRGREPAGHIHWHCP